MEPEVKPALATGAVVVAMLFDPAHIFKSFLEQGWSIKRFKPPADFSVKRLRDNGRTIEIGNLKYFLQLVASALYREDYVVRL